MKSLWTVVASVALAAIAGCGGGTTIETAIVEGTVTKDGQPVYPARVTFSPIGAEGATETGKPASTTTGVDGSYRLENAVVGSNAVSVIPEATDPDSEEEEDNEMDIPLVGKPSQESYSVKSGENKIDIMLTGP